MMFFDPLFVLLHEIQWTVVGGWMDSDSLAGWMDGWILPLRVRPSAQFKCHKTNDARSCLFEATECI